MAPSIDPIWRGGFPVYVPADRLGEARDLLADVPSSARPILPRAVAIIVLVAFVAPLLAQAVQWLTR